MEDAKTLVKKLLQDPYKAVLLQDYNRVQNHRKNRKKLEEIEKEVTWYNGKSNRYKIEDRQGFLQHYQKNYSKEKAIVSARYRSIVDYPNGQEPVLLYFVLLFEKKYQQMQEFQTAHPLSDLKVNMNLTLEYKKLVNEYRLLGFLLERMAKFVDGIERSIDECFVTDFLSDTDTMELPALQSRFYRAVRSNVSPEVAAELLEKIKAAGAKETAYMEAMVWQKKKEYTKAIECLSDIDKENPSYASAKAMMMECCANTGNIKGFIEAFSAIRESRLDSMYFIYLLQKLVCNASYKELDTDEFEQDVQEMLKSEFNQTPNPVFTGLVSRTFVSILLEGLPIAEKLTRIKMESGEEAIPEEELESLYRLQMALQLYPVQEVGDLIDIDYMEAHGPEYCRVRIGRQAVAMLLEKNPDKSFDNIFLAFTALERVGMMEAYAKNVESNLENLVRYAENGQKRAISMIRKAYEWKKNKGEESEAMAEALEAFEAE